MRWLVAAIFLAVPAQADGGRLPALFDVVGVAADDRLNVRAQPDGSAEILGDLAANAVNIEVVRLNASGAWGQVNLGERAGWASMRFLSRQAGQPDDQPPAITTCYGTEPFWSLNLIDRSFRTPLEELPIDTPVIRAASGRSEPWGIIAQTERGPIHGILSRNICSDGMSDQQYGLQLDLTHAGSEVYTGCCTLSP
ncbi:hypothetical protein SAMN05444004_101313 [Jannaschia faecimaris]|uniref:SH3 domain-containing protein n=1 Tax=Jannaschia faecimaris TaxID=1244108 RepID=A0A1H3JFD5_9RHOB|nr:hypothetical protein [Jannaschia faecimaris]SDY38622.1 hypothetical protein SAMN05444004_101313 [Jannaschia faecimaris]